MFAPLVAALRELAPALGARSATASRTTRSSSRSTALHVLNACDTAAVREGLLDDALLAQARARARSARRSSRRRHRGPIRHTRSPRSHRRSIARGSPIGLRALRAGSPARRRAGGGRRRCGRRARRHRARGLRARCDLPALVLRGRDERAVADGAARRARRSRSVPRKRDRRRCHAAVARAAAPAGRAARRRRRGVRYRLRLVEAALAQRPLRELLAGDANLGPLGTLSAKLASATDPDAIVHRLRRHRRERRARHAARPLRDALAGRVPQMLKALCDLYGLRKDELRSRRERGELPRVDERGAHRQGAHARLRAGPAASSRSGRAAASCSICSRRGFPTPEIIGVDLSREVVAALEARARAGNHRWKRRARRGRGAARAGAASTVDTVVFCSILHEVYSYTERRPKFQLESVRDVVRAAWATLRPGGRIVIRDGVMPPPGTRRISCVAPDARADVRPLRRAVRGPHDSLSRARARSRRAVDAPTRWSSSTRTRGARRASRTRCASSTASCRTTTTCARSSSGSAARASRSVVEIPAELRSYLQPGYRDNLAGKIELTDEHDRPVELPDSNCLIVVEKP